MGRILESELNQIKAIDLVQLLRSQGFDLQPHGKDQVCRCPFHEDKTPSLVVSPKTNLWHCLGACGIGGSVIDWVMQLEQVSFAKAVSLLRNDHSSLSGHQLKPTAAKKKAMTSSDERPAGDSNGDNPEDQTLLNRVVGFYHQRLLASDVGLAYLTQRGLNDADLIETFRLGYCDRTLSPMLASRTSRRGKAERAALKRLGVTAASGSNLMAGSITVPVRAHGHVQQLYGRKINPVRQGDGVHRYLSGPLGGIWNQSGITDQTDLILCESLLDAMTLWVHGFKNVTTSYGVNGFTEELFEFIQSSGIERVFIAYDRDEAGDRAATALIDKLAQASMPSARLKLPPGMDVNEWALDGDDFKTTFNDGLLSAVSSLAAGPVAAVQSPTRPGEVVTATAAQPPGVAVRHNGDDVHIEIAQRHYRIRDLNKNKPGGQLKVNVMLTHGDLFFIDGVDLYQAKQRAAFIKQASVDCGLDAAILQSDLGKLLLTLESIQEQSINEIDGSAVDLSEDERDAALALLKFPDLTDRIIDDFKACGVVGEDANTLVGYLAATSRHLDKPLAILIQSSSAAGKSSLMDAVLSLMPEEQRVQYSAMTGQSLFYMGETDLKHKILAIAEEEGASQASYALKLLQSEGEVTIASTGKDETTGDLTTKEYRVEGPVMLFLTTTAIDIDEELMNRCLVLTVNESKVQTEAIHQQQRYQDTLAGLLARQQSDQIKQIHRNAQRLLKPLQVVNPYAEQLTFVSHQTRTRRDHQKYLTLIKSITLLHQYQRQIKTITHHDKQIDYIEVTEGDIKLANQLVRQVMGRTLDELPPQTRRLLNRVYDYVQTESQSRQCAPNDVFFSRRQIREATGWGNTQLKVHCRRLEDMEYLLIEQGGRGQRIRYRLMYDGQGGDEESPASGVIRMGLMHLDQEKSGQKDDRSGSSRPQVGPKSGGGRGSNNRPKANEVNGSVSTTTTTNQKRTSRANAINGSGAHP